MLVDSWEASAAVHVTGFKIFVSSNLVTFLRIMLLVNNFSSPHSSCLCTIFYYGFSTAFIMLHRGRVIITSYDSRLIFIIGRGLFSYYINLYLKRPMSTPETASFIITNFRQSFTSPDQLFFYVVNKYLFLSWCLSFPIHLIWQTRWHIFKFSSLIFEFYNNLIYISPNFRIYVKMMEFANTLWKAISFLPCLVLQHTA